MTPVILGLLALLLAGPVPVLLARAQWPHRVPRAAIVLWQALALAAVLAALGAGLSLGSELILQPELGPLEIALYTLVTVLTCVVAGRLFWATVKVAVRTRARRRRHRELVDLLARHLPATGVAGVSVPNIRVLAERTPLAYCLPGVRGSRVVVSEGALERLRPEELAGVLTHELAHVRARHDLVVEAFTALREAFPSFVRLRMPLEQNQLLIEMLADDAARRRVGAAPVTRALVTLATASAPAGGLAAAANGTLLPRVRRLAEPASPHRLLSAVTYLTAAAIVTVPTVTVALPWLIRLADALA
ncbi:M56 family metallopeptidase [Thermasporomyces composti]|jgi:Zn-dependent protease with chaperone function|uniref:Peptidase M48-like protein n=1 Tax=Thermasporomyces composti TaxID=696763 RepID=A0A3D9V125_THECX|nr:M56 family metallopeptidase [Thermasporomyces composti]REF35217.1 peptidase M48-like protein [Thermasporomyces composti]